MSYRVELTEGAYADFDRLTTSLAQRSPEAADRLSARFYEALSRLESHPHACGLAYEK
jgi:plasmid stabilization system protein ParE